MASINLNSTQSLLLFKILMEKKTVTDTAKIMALTQPGVSRALAQFEKNIGIKLFVRRKNRLIPNQEALELYPRVLQLLNHLDELKHNITSLKEFGASRVSFAVIPGLGFGFFPHIISQILAANSSIGIYFDVMSSHDVVKAVETGLADIGVVTLPYDREQLHSETLVSTEAVCILPENHALVSKSSIDARDLENEHLVIANQPNVAADKLLSLLTRFQIRISGKTEANIASICSLVGNGLGISVINPITAYDLAHPSLIIRPFTPSIEYKFGLIYNERWSRSRMLNQIREHLPSPQVYQGLIKNYSRSLSS